MSVKQQVFFVFFLFSQYLALKKKYSNFHNLNYGCQTTQHFELILTTRVGHIIPLKKMIFKKHGTLRIFKQLTDFYVE